MSDCINYYFIRDVDKISEHVFRIHNIEREKKGGGEGGREREREREPMKVKKATPLMEGKSIFSISRNGLISLDSICMDSPGYIKYSFKTLKNWN